MANNDESTRYATFASITVVSARTRFVLSTLASAALTNNESFNASIVAGPHRVVIFINVVGCGVTPPRGIRQNRGHVIESPSSLIANQDAST